MNNKGQVILFAFMMCVVIIVFALGIAFAVREGSNNAMSNATNPNDGMNCSNPLNPDSTTAACYVTDFTPFLFIGILIAIAGIVLVGKWMTQ